MKRLPKDERPHREGFFELMTRLKNQSDDDKQLKDEEKIKLDKKDMRKRGLPIVSMQQKCLGSSSRMHLTNFSLLGLFPSKE